MDKTYKRKDIDSCTIEFEVVIPKDSFTKSYNTLFAQESKKIDLRGFRKGNVPANLLESGLKPQILQETFEKIAPLFVAQAVSIENVEVVAPPVYKDIPKLDIDQDITFKVDVTIMPEAKVGNLSKVKVEMKKVEVSDKEVDELITEMEKNPAIKAKKGTKAWVEENAKELELKDVKDLDGLRAELKRLLTIQKENIVKRDWENEVLQKAIELSKISIPQPAIDYEAHEREHSFMHNLENKKIDLDTFMKANNLTIEVMREMWKKDAKEALETDAFLKAYAKENDIEVSEKDLKEEIEKIKTKNAGLQYDFENKEWQAYITRVLFKEKAFGSFLEKVTPKKK